jgi:hypothetical protein
MSRSSSLASRSLAWCVGLSAGGSAPRTASTGQKIARPRNQGCDIIRPTTSLPLAFARAPQPSAAPSGVGRETAAWSDPQEIGMVSERWELDDERVRTRPGVHLGGKDGAPGRPVLQGPKTCPDVNDCSGASLWVSLAGLVRVDCQGPAERLRHTYDGWASTTANRTYPSAPPASCRPRPAATVPHCPPVLAPTHPSDGASLIGASYRVSFTRATDAKERLRTSTASFDRAPPSRAPYPAKCPEARSI